jgi:adenylate cyclase, class 2
MVIEIELKFELKNTEEITRELKEKAEFLGEECQKDTYYIPIHRNFVKQNPVSEWLRLREVNNNTSINYKKWHFVENKKSVSCDEFESLVEKPDEIKKIFKNLDIKELIIVEKLRKSFKYKNATISIDHVNELGDYIEIEIMKDSREEIEMGKQEIYGIAKELDANLGEENNEGYPFILLKKKNLI